MDKKQLALGIIAFDLIFQDALGDIENGNTPHPLACAIFEGLIHQISSPVEIGSDKNDYIINMQDIASRLRMLTISMDIDEENLLRVIAIQKDRLALLGKGILGDTSKIH